MPALLTSNIRNTILPAVRDFLSEYSIDDLTFDSVLTRGKRTFDLGYHLHHLFTHVPNIASEIKLRKELEAHGATYLVLRKNTERIRSEQANTDNTSCTPIDPYAPVPEIDNDAHFSNNIPKTSVDDSKTKTKRPEKSDTSTAHTIRNTSRNTRTVPAQRSIEACRTKYKDWVYKTSPGVGEHAIAQKIQHLATINSSGKRLPRAVTIGRISISTDDFLDVTRRLFGAGDLHKSTLLPTLKLQDIIASARSKVSFGSPTATNESQHMIPDR